MTSPSEALSLFAQGLGFQARLTRDEHEKLLHLPCAIRSFEPGAYLVRDGEAPLLCAVLLSGFAFRQKLTSQGARQIVSLHIPGEPLDFQNLFLQTADHNVQALTRVEAAMVPREAIRSLVRTCPGIANAVLVYVLIEASIFREWILNIGRRDARSRLAHLLCEFAVRLDAQNLAEPDGYDLPMTQEQLGDALGLTSVHVNRTIKSLENDGLIRRERRRISFPSWEALREIADFNSRYLHLDRRIGE